MSFKPFKETNKKYQYYREEAANVHISIADFCYSQLKSMGKDVIMKKDLELKDDDIKDRDLLISLGKNFMDLLY